jgi:hypothetical protein
MNVNHENDDNILYIDEKKENEILLENNPAYSTAKGEKSLTIPNENQRELIEKFKLNLAKTSSKETREFPWYNFFYSTIWTLVLMTFYYLDIAADIVLLIHYANNQMWFFFGVTLLFILLLPLIAYLSILIVLLNGGEYWSFIFMLFMTAVFYPLAALFL